MARVVKNRSKRCLATLSRQAHHRTMLDDHRSYLHGTGRGLTAERRQALLGRVLATTPS
jgi:hypothetical protein